jgi:hypothetical protein
MGLVGLDRGAAGLGFVFLENIKTFSMSQFEF